MLLDERLFGIFIPENRSQIGIPHLAQNTREKITNCLLNFLEKFKGE
jgi:hypothetical protein